MFEKKYSVLPVVLLYLTLISGISPLHSFVSSFEHSPYGILLVFAFGRVNFPALSLWMAMTTIYLITLLYYNVPLSLEAVAGLIQMLNFTAPLFILRGNERLIGKACERVFWLYILVGCMQILHLLVPLEPLLDLLIARFQGAPFSGWRGVTMLETEPARAGFQILMLYVIATNFNSKKSVSMTLVLIFSQFAIISSTTGIILTIIYFTFSMAPRIFNKASYTLVLAVVSVAFTYVASSQPKVDLIIEAYRTGGIPALYNTLAAISGGRFLATMNGIVTVMNWPIGWGANPEFLFAEKVVTDEYSVAGYLTRISGKPISSLLHYLYYFGILMLMPLWFAIRRNLIHPNPSLQFWALLVIGILYTPPGNELWIIAICAALSRKRVVSRSARNQDEYFASVRKPKAAMADKTSCKSSNPA